MSKVASAAAAMGVGEDQLAAQLSTIISVTKQAPESVGTALRTVYARITDIKAGVAEDGTTLGRYSGKMAQMGINVLDLNGNLRDMGTVMEEIGAKWGTMTREQQVYLAQTMAGQRQYNNLLALFDNFDKYNSALETAQNAEGTLTEQNETHMESLSTHLQQLTTATEEMWMNLTDTEGIKDLVDGLTSIIQKVDKLFKSLGGGKALLNSLGAISMKLVSGTVSKSLSTTLSNRRLAQQQQAENKEKAQDSEAKLQQLAKDSKTDTAEYRLEQQRKEFFSKKQGTFSREQMEAINKQWEKAAEGANKADLAADQIKKANLTASLLGSGKIIGSTQEEREASYQSAQNEFVNLAEDATDSFVKLGGSSEELDKVIITLTNNITEENKKIQELTAQLDTVPLTQQGLNQREMLQAEIEQKKQNVQKTQQKVANFQIAKNNQSQKAMVARIFDEQKKTAYNYDTGKFKDKNFEDLAIKENELYKAETPEQRKNIQQQITLIQNKILENIKASVLPRQKAKIDWKGKDSKSFSMFKNSDKLSSEITSNETFKKLKVQYQLLVKQINAYNDAISTANEEQLKELQNGRQAIIDKIGDISQETSQFLREKGEQVGQGIVAEREQQQGQQQQDKAQQIIDDESYRVNMQQGLQAAMNLAGGLAQVQAGFQSLMYIGDIWADDTLTNTQKLNQTFSNLLITLPMMISGFTSAAVAVKTLAGEQTLAAAIKGLLTKQIWANTAGLKANTIALFTNLGALAKQIATTAWTSLGPWGLLAAAILAVVAATNMVAEAQKKAAQEQIKANEKIIDQEKKKQEEIKHNQDIISEVEALNKQYEDGIITRQELKEKTQELQEKYQDESKEIRNLISDYNNLGDAVKRARKKQLDDMAQSKAKEAEKLGQNIDLKLTSQHKTQDDILGGIFSSGFGSLGAKAQGNAALQTGVGGNDANFANTVGNLLQGAGLGKTNSGTGGNYIELFNAKNEEEARKQIEILQQAVEAASDEDKQTDTYRNIQSLLEEMSPMLEEWKSANLQSLNLIAQQEANRQSNNFNNINNFEEYEQAYQKTSKAVYEQLQKEGELQGLSTEQINDIVTRKTEAIIPKDLKTQYGNKMDNINRINHYNGTGYFGLEETDDEIVKLINGLNEEQLAKFSSINIEYLPTLEDVKDILKTIDGYEFKNLEFNNVDAKKAAQTYNNMANALQKVQNSKAISTKDFEENLGLTDEIKEYFRLGNNGYILKDESQREEVERLIKEQQRSGWDEKYRVQQNIKENEQAWMDSTAKGYNYQKYNQAQPVIKQLQKWLFENNQQQSNFDKAQQMLNKLATINDDDVKLNVAVYRKFLENGEISKQNYETIYNYFDELSKKHKDAADKITQANEQQQEALQQIHESIFPTDNDVDETLVAKLGQQFQLTAKKSKLLDDALESNAKKAKDVAEEVQRYNSALSAVIKNYATWQDKLSGSTADKLSVAPQIKDAMADTLGISESTLSDTFATTKQNLEDMRLALEGDEKAYKRLQQAAYEDILIHIGLDDAELNKVKTDLSAYFDKLDLEDIPVGAKLNEQGLDKVLAALIAKGVDTEQQLEAIFASFDVDLDVVIEDGQAIIKSYTKAATHELKEQQKSQEELKDLERERIKNQKELTKFLKDERDIYHEINRLLSDQERTIKRITRNQQDMYGTELLDNLSAESAEYKKQEKLLKSKQRLQQQDLANKRAELVSKGASFDANGNISNYNNLVGNATNNINAIISRERGVQEAMNQHLLNGGSTSDEIYKDLDVQLFSIGKEKSQANDYLNDLKTNLSNYEKVKDQAEDVADQLTELSEKQIEINLKKFNMKLEVTLDLSQATKTWNDYKRNVLQHDDIFNHNRALSAQKDNAQKLADINTDSQSLDVVNKQIAEAMADNGTLYKTQGQKKKAIEELQKKAIQLRKGILENEDAIKQTYLEQYDIISEMFEKQKSQYDFVNNQLEHNKNMMSLIYGENDYAVQNVYNDKMIENSLKSIESMNNRVQIAEENLRKARESGDTAVIEKAEAEWQTAIQNRNQLEEQSAQLLKDRYTAAINQISHQMEQKLTNNKGFGYLDTQWDLMKKQSNLYLDDINSAFAVKNTEYLYNQALNDTKGLKSQQQLKKVMSEQLEILKEKDKLTQYDVDRAGKVLEIEKARIALEQARNNKTQMRLKRDSQGNYSYQYVADQDNIAKAENDLQKAENDLYNFDKENYEKSLEEAYNATKEYQEKIKALNEEYITATEERRKQINEERKLLEAQYSNYILNLSQETEWSKQNLLDSAMMHYSEVMDKEAIDFENMSDIQKNKWLQDMVPSINTGIAEMIGRFSEDPDSFRQIVIKATQAMDNERKTYQKGLAELQTAAGQNWNKIKQAMDPVVELQNELIIDNDRLKDQAGEIVDAMNGTLDALTTQADKWQAVYDKIDAAVLRVYDYIKVIDEAALKKLNEDENNGGGEGIGGGIATGPISGIANTIKAIPPSSSKSPSSTGNPVKSSNLKSAPGWDMKSIVNKAIEITKNSKINSGALFSKLTLGNQNGQLYLVGFDLQGKTIQKGDGISAFVNKVKDLGPGKFANYFQGVMRDMYGFINGWNKFSSNKIKFDTGGYTGDWNSSEGKLAILHEKELVLNKQDTANMLEMIQMVREMQQNELKMRMTQLNNEIQDIVKQNAQVEKIQSKDDLKQSVEMNVNFPNVNSKKEIEQALTELVNLAAQRALKYKK